jgi:predicted permease
VGLLSTLIFALVPALQTSKLDVAGALKSESAGAAGSRSRSRIRSGLVLVQVALSFLLLVGSVLLLESMQRIRDTSPGFAVDGMLTTGVNLFSAGYTPDRARSFLEQLMERLHGVRGIESAAYSRIAPFSYATLSNAPIAIDGYQQPRNEPLSSDYLEVSPSYFSTLSIPLISGREFTRADDEAAPPVAIVNEEMVNRYWSGQDPVGKRLKLKDRWLRVVGVARTAKYGTFTEPPKALFYVPLRQNFSTRVALHIRTRETPATMANALAQLMLSIDPDVAPSPVITMREQLDRANSGQRIAVILLGLFGTIALLLAGVGLYGVMSYAVSQSTRELGLRMALGATVPRLLRLVMSKGLLLTLAGVALGGIAALALTRLLGYLLYRVSPRDPVAFGVAFAVMMIAASAASFLPAWRATRIDPVRALRDT